MLLILWGFFITSIIVITLMNNFFLQIKKMHPYIKNNIALQNFLILGLVNVHGTFF